MNSGVFLEGLNDKERRAPTHLHVWFMSEALVQGPTRMWGSYTIEMLLPWMNSSAAVGLNEPSLFLQASVPMNG